MSTAVLAYLASKSQGPELLYHGSAFKQDELKPGYMHTKKAVVWDKYESNIYLYSTSIRESAELLGISSAWEKKYELEKTSFDEKTKTINLTFYGNPPKVENLYNTEVYVYTIKNVPGVWIKNNNPFNNIDNEYKTKATIKEIMEVSRLDVQSILKDYTINIK